MALHADCTLVSLDHEHLTRLTAVVRACAPAAALAEMQALLADESLPAEAASGKERVSQDAANQSESNREPGVEAGAAPEARAEEGEASSEEAEPQPPAEDL